MSGNTQKSPPCPENECVNDRHFPFIELFVVSCSCFSLSLRLVNSRPSTTCASCSFKTSRLGLKKLVPHVNMDILLNECSTVVRLPDMFFLHRVQKLDLMIVGGLTLRNRRFPFLKTTWISLQRFINRSGWTFLYIFS